MPDVVRLSNADGPYVYLRVSKGVVLKMTLAQYRQALYAYKMERRADRRALRHQQTQARQEAGRLGWIEEG